MSAYFADAYFKKNFKILYRSSKKVIENEVKWVTLFLSEAISNF